MNCKTVLIVVTNTMSSILCVGSLFGFVTPLGVFAQLEIALQSQAQNIVGLCAAEQSATFVCTLDNLSANILPEISFFTLRSLHAQSMPLCALSSAVVIHA